MRIPIQNSFILDNNILQVLTSMLDCIALAMERIQADAKHLKFKEEANAQRYRANLLRAISHDLRTPLAGIMGTCEMLKKMLDDKEKEYEKMSVARYIHFGKNKTIVQKWSLK